MGKIKIAPAIAAALVLLLVGTYCGTGTTKLMSIAVSPNTATATSPAGTVQFTAMGKFSNNTTRMLTVSNGLTWMSSNTTMATISNTGMAQCMMAGGPITLTASAPTTKGSTLMVNGTAVLTCT